MRAGSPESDLQTMAPGVFPGENGADMQDRIQAFDWSTTPLGSYNSWPQSLRTVVQILLSSRYAMWMAWGPTLTMLYNDSYQPTLGLKHPGALGEPANEVWAEIWPDIGPRIQSVLATGKATYDQGLLLILQRSGFPEETYHTFSYSPLADDTGHICGMLCVVTEETERIIGERRVNTLREVSSALTGTITESEVLKALQGVLSLHRKDLPFTLTYLFDQTGEARLASSSGISREHPLAVERIKTGCDYPWPAGRLLRQPGLCLVEDFHPTYATTPLPSGEWNRPVQQAVVAAIKQQGQEAPAGFFVAGANPYRRFDTAYEGFVDLLSGQVASGLSNARAYESERQRAEALAQLDRAKTTFFSNVSHELRTPLTLMLGPVEELLARFVQANATGEAELLELVYRNGLRLQKLVNGLLDFSRIEAGRMQAAFEPVDLAIYTAEIAGSFRSAMERAGLQFVVACKPLTQPVYIDRDMWEKIVLNLLSNALKFTFHGAVSISVHQSEGKVHLQVEDSGIGIAASDLPYIFERFHRVESGSGRTIEGTGIGLALVQELVKLHTGTVNVESEVGRGSRFTVSLPLAANHLPKHKIETASGNAMGTHHSEPFVREAMRWLSTPADGFKTNFDDSPPSLPVDVNGTAVQARDRILFADDNADMREYVTRLLGDRFQVISAANGEEALRSAIANPPDLVLSDVMMPALDGFGLLAALRQHAETRAIPVILLSARAGEESRVDGLGAGADDYLVKPFTARELIARVSAHLAMRKRRDEAEQAVRESQVTLQSFYDSSPFLMGVVEVEGDDIISVYGNRATANLLAIDMRAMNELQGKSFGLPQEVQRTWLLHCRRSQAEATAVRFEYEHAAVSGTRWLSCAVSFLGPGPGYRPRFSFIAEDITEKRRAEDIIRRSNEELRRANSDLEQFAFSASHDLQEPLRQVSIYSQLLEKKYGPMLEGKALNYLAYCVEGAQRMEMLITDLLAYSQAGRVSERSNESIDLNAVLDGVKKNLTTAMEETEATVTVPPLPKVDCDAVPMTHLFQNLISNALKYRSDKSPRIAISVTDQHPYWCFAVEDNGIGIPSAYQAQVFGIFKRLHDRKKYQGTGMGLAICQKIVEGYGGRIWVESEVDRGSKFLFTLPMEKVK